MRRMNGVSAVHVAITSTSHYIHPTNVINGLGSTYRLFDLRFSGTSTPGFAGEFLVTGFM